MSKDKKKLIEDLFEKGILVQEDLAYSDEVKQTILDTIESEADLLVLNKDYLDILEQQKSLVDWYEIDGYKVEAEKERNEELYQGQLQLFKKAGLSITQPGCQQRQVLTSLESSLKSSIEFEDGPGKINLDLSQTNSLLPYSTEEIIADSGSSACDLLETEKKMASIVTVVMSYENKPKKYIVDDFVKIFRTRLKFIENVLHNRRELQNATAISRIQNKTEREEVSLIGLVEEKGETKTGHLIITVEDFTGKIKVLISKNKKELYLQGKDLVLDEVVGIVGTSGDKVVFADKIIWPDVPLNNELKKSEAEEYAVFLSDIHVGSALFLNEEFNRFLSWINGGFGSEIHQKIAEKVKYVFIAGDLVDGIGVYPSQEEELKINDISLQYQELSRLLGQIPSRIQVIICPGNHDVVHLAEPQPRFYQRFAGDLFNLPNVKLVTNPALINIGRTNAFPGFNVLMYHGFSFDYYVANVESIRAAGGYRRSDLIMKFLLKRRHLAPSFRSTPYVVSHDEDPLLIKSIPDFLITGHIHYSSVANYNGITMISGSCWQAKTTFQEKLGHEPEPARVPVVNLKTREVKVLRFG
ncbi:DNA-directed DNA polymerase II small subunit [Candidatus Woesearchaeota archaeon]|nr:DNA-directed DNA polymerase II small subunit [Candidatus Woesearchaeota archaeon]